MKTAVGLFLLLLFTACHQLNEYDRQRISSVLADSLTSRTETWGFELTLVNDGKRSFKANAAYGFTQETDSGAVTHASGPVRIQIFDSTGNGIYQTVDCGELTYYGRTAFLKLSGNVLVKTLENRRLEAGELVWIQSRKMLTSTGFVTVVTPDDSISGYGLRAKDDLSEYTIKEVTGEVSVEKENR